MKTIIPKCRFELLGLDREAELFYSFMKNNRFSEIFDKAYPDLRLIQETCMDENDCLRKYQEFLENLRDSKASAMLEFKEKIEFAWGNINDEFLELLANHFETNWPEDKPEIVGCISNLPVFPRFLDDYQFCVSYKNVDSSIEVIAHEILHFLWFKKWKEVFPTIERKEYECPHLVWRLSEIMDPIILQCYEPIGKLIKPKKWGYDSFEKIYIDGVSMTDFFKSIYLNGLVKGTGFSVILESLWGAAQKYEKELSSF